MNRTVIIISIMLFAISANAQQGIQFITGSWKQILEQAKTENKLIFVDVYTSWCGPCRQMAAEVFPQADVAELFNASFVNYKIDAEKGEGITLAKQYTVNAYPTYLFVDGDGKLIYRTAGYMPADRFIKEAEVALNERHDPKPLVVWEKEYEDGNRDTGFLVGYMKKRSQSKLPSADLIEELMPKLSQDQRLDKEILGAIYFEEPNIQLIPDGRAFNYLLDNRVKLDSLNLIKYALSILEMGINNYFQKNIIPGGREDQLQIMIESYRKLLEASDVDKPEQDAITKGLVMNYYNGTNQLDKLAAAALDYVNNGLMKTNVREKIESDKKSYSDFMKAYVEGKADSLADPEFPVMKRLMKHRKMAEFSYNLRDAAEYIYNQSDDPKMLQLASGWAAQANEYFPHFSSASVYAGLLLKTGKQTQAIREMEVACRDSFLSDSEEMKKKLQSALESIRKGEIPQALWR